MQKMIQKYYDQLAKEQGKDMITVFADNASEELKNAVMEAHGDRMPNDWIFEKFRYILDALGQYDITTIDGIEDNRGEIVDGLVDVYTPDLTAWLNSSNFNIYHLTEALEETEIKDGFQALAVAQYKAIDKIFSEVIALLEGQTT